VIVWRNIRVDGLANRQSQSGLANTIGITFGKDADRARRLARIAELLSLPFMTLLARYRAGGARLSTPRRSR